MIRDRAQESTITLSRVCLAARPLSSARRGAIATNVSVRRRRVGASGEPGSPGGEAAGDRVLLGPDCGGGGKGVGEGLPGGRAVAGEGLADAQGLLDLDDERVARAEAGDGEIAGPGGYSGRRRRPPLVEDEVRLVEERLRQRRRQARQVILVDVARPREIASGSVVLLQVVAESAQGGEALGDVRMPGPERRLAHLQGGLGMLERLRAAGLPL